jgi:hypothetical protein
MEVTTTFPSSSPRWLHEALGLGLGEAQQQVGVSRCYGRNDDSRARRSLPGYKARSTSLGSRSGGVVTDRIELASKSTLPSTERHSRTTTVAITRTEQNESSLSQEGNFQGLRARRCEPRRGTRLPMVKYGSGSDFAEEPVVRV